MWGGGSTAAPVERGLHRDLHQAGVPPSSPNACILLAVTFLFFSPNSSLRCIIWNQHWKTEWRKIVGRKTVMLPTHTAYCSAIPQRFPIAFTVLFGDVLACTLNHRRTYMQLHSSTRPVFIVASSSHQVRHTTAYYLVPKKFIVTPCYEGYGGRSPPNPRPRQRPKEG